jgi:hypothetical protein
VQFGTQANTNLGKMDGILKQSNLVGLENVHVLCKGQQMHFGKKSAIIQRSQGWAISMIAI